MMLQSAGFQVSVSGRPCVAGFRARRQAHAQRLSRCHHRPIVGALQLNNPAQGQLDHSSSNPVTKEDVIAVETELALGEGVAAVHRFNEALCKLDSENWEAKLRPVFNEWCFNLESFNPAFTAALLKVQQSIGESDYFRRDEALKNLIQPLAGEYGMHNGQEQAKTHRQLFCEFYSSLFQESIADLLADGERPKASELMFEQMMRDILGGGECETALEQASYALGYNLAIEYLAQVEKGTMLDSFRVLDKKIFAAKGLSVEWTFLEIHAIDEIEHAAIGHDAVRSFVPESHLPILKRAAQDHNKDFAVFYNKLTEMLK